MGVLVIWRGHPFFFSKRVSSVLYVREVLPNDTCTQLNGCLPSLVGLRGKRTILSTQRERRSGRSGAYCLAPETTLGMGPAHTGPTIESIFRSGRSHLDVERQGWGGFH